MSDSSSKEKPVSRLAVGVLILLLAGGTAPWWLQLLLSRPSFPSSAGTWKGIAERTVGNPQKNEKSEVELTLHAAGALQIGGEVTILFDRSVEEPRSGQTPYKSGKFRVEAPVRVPEEAGNLLLKSTEVTAQPGDKPDGDYWARLAPATDNMIKIQILDSSQRPLLTTGWVTLSPK
ncbi:MAG: hypothetical protein AB7I19_11360 [Planctomycetota bacterium]